MKRKIQGQCLLERVVGILKEVVYEEDFFARKAKALFKDWLYF